MQIQESTGIKAQVEDYRLLDYGTAFSFKEKQILKMKKNYHHQEKTSQQTTAAPLITATPVLTHREQLQHSEKVHLPRHLYTNFRWKLFQVIRNLYLMLIFLRLKMLQHSSTLLLIAKQHP